MTTLFLVCAGVGTVVLLLHLVMGVWGADFWDGELPEAEGVFGTLSFRAVVGAVAAFGMGGMAARSVGLGTMHQVVLALTAGGAVGWLAMFLFRSLRKLEDAGTVRLEGAVGKMAQVYVSIPAGRSGQGKVQLDLSNRTVEIAAMTVGEGLEPGANVRVVRMIDGQTVEVEAA
jgi:hypothetical protein